MRIRVCMKVMRIQLPLFTSMCFRIPIFTMMRDPDPTYNFDADADPDPAPHQSDANPRPLAYRPSAAHCESSCLRSEHPRPGSCSSLKWCELGPPVYRPPTQFYFEPPRLHLWAFTALPCFIFLKPRFEFDAGPRLLTLMRILARTQLLLKVVDNEKGGGSGGWQMFGAPLVLAD